MSRILANESKVLRHSFSVRIVHWAIALSTFLLLFSGFGQMPLYKRYMLTEVPGFIWTGDYFSTLKLHYMAALVFIVAVVWHVTIHFIRKEYGLIPRKGDVGESIRILAAMATGKPEPPADKYLAEQRLAYVYIGANILLLLGSGLFKVVKNFGVHLDNSFMYWVTLVHNVTAVLLLLGIVAHLLAFVPKANRNLLPSMFTGKVGLEYAEHRHSIWMKKVKGHSNRKKVAKGRRI